MPHQLQQAEIKLCAHRQGYQGIKQCSAPAIQTQQGPAQAPLPTPPDGV